MAEAEDGDRAVSAAGIAALDERVDVLQAEYKTELAQLAKETAPRDAEFAKRLSDDRAETAGLARDMAERDAEFAGRLSERRAKGLRFGPAGSQRGGTRSPQYREAGRDTNEGGPQLGPGGRAVGRRPISCNRSEPSGTAPPLAPGFVRAQALRAEGRSRRRAVSRGRRCACHRRSHNRKPPTIRKVSRR